MNFEVYYEAFRALLTISTIFFAHFVLVLINWFGKSTTALENILEFFVIVLPIILSVTVLDEWIVQLILLMAVITIAIILMLREHDNCKEQTEITKGRQNCVTLCRSSVYLITSVCICAVDFKIFGHHLMKVREYGCGLMDTGIGLFIFSTAIVPKKVSAKQSYWQDLITLSKQALPLLILGGARTLLLKLINYHQDVTEYGLHWNAFLTIAVTRFFGGAIYVLFSNRLVFASLVIIFVHEVALECGIASWVMSSETQRDTILTANREGIISIPGFLAIYLMSRYFSVLIDKQSSSMMDGLGNLDRRKKIQTLTYKLYLAFFLFGPITHVSRRIANMGYFFWVMLIAGTMLVLFLYLEEVIAKFPQEKNKVSKYLKLPAIVEAINYNALFFFLISNILTGAINIFLNPSEQDNLTALVILVLYMATVCYVTVYLYKNKIKIA